MVKLRDRSLADDTKYYYSSEKMSEAIDLAGISGYRIIYDETGLWAHITKYVLAWARSKRNSYPALPRAR
jgi:hypothetical protein